MQINRAKGGGDAIKLVDRTITSCWVAGEDPPSEVTRALKASMQTEGAVAADLQDAPLESRADVLVMDTFDHACLGMHALRNVSPPHRLWVVLAWNRRASSRSAIISPAHAGLTMVITKCPPVCYGG